MLGHGSQKYILSLEGDTIMYNRNFHTGEAHINQAGVLLPK